MSKTLNGCFAGMVIVSLSLWLMSRWIIQEVLLVYGELLGGAALPAITALALNFGDWGFLGHAFAVGVSWATLLRWHSLAQVSHFLLYGLAATQVGLVDWGCSPIVQHPLATGGGRLIINPCGRSKGGDCSRKNPN